MAWRAILTTCLGNRRNTKEMDKMIRNVVSTGLILFTACGAFGQSATTPSFDVASVKPAAPPTDGRLMIDRKSVV